MDAKTFNQNYELDRKTRTGVRANPKHASPIEPPPIMTADGKPYNPNETYHFFDAATQEIRQSTGLRRDDEHLCAFGLKVVAVANLRAERSGALADGQTFFNSEIERLRERIRKYEAEKPPAARSLKAVLMSR